MKVLALASYPIEAAATRYRLAQFVAPLAERGITLTVRPFINSQMFAALYQPRRHMPRTILGLLKSATHRLGDVWRAQDADVLLVQREAMIFGPPLIEWLATRALRRPMVLDLDDATYIPYVSPTYGRLARALKWFGKTDDLIRWAKIVTCGNRSIADYVAAQGGRAVIIPTVVDTEQFRPVRQDSQNDIPVVGWIGSHSTYPFLEAILPTLQQLARTQTFRLKVVGSGRKKINVPGLNIENLEWSLEREINDFQSLDIGLYPIVPGGTTPGAWTAGKSGFKAVQYMAVGIPYVVTPIGACAEMGEPGVTHIPATSHDQWYEALARLLSDAKLRKSMGEAGRRYALQHYTVQAQAEKLAQVLREALAA
ncbi:MAG TPA: glycosyltransferase family 4 protein [Pyrinomonadaceae bacterium]|nr:glycosyltransferase family 4 protein [Pyrinomonadaceae bacterium]